MRHKAGAFFGAAALAVLTHAAAADVVTLNFTGFNEDHLYQPFSASFSFLYDGGTYNSTQIYDGQSGETGTPFVVAATFEESAYDGYPAVSQNLASIPGFLAITWNKGYPNDNDAVYEAYFDSTDSSVFYDLRISYDPSFDYPNSLDAPLPEITYGADGSNGFVGNGYDNAADTIFTTPELFVSTFSVAVTPVPEPGSMAGIGGGMAASLLTRRRRRRSV